MTDLTFLDVASLYGSLAFVLLIAIIYYSKSKLGTIENILYNFLLFMAGFNILLTGFRILIPYISINTEILSLFYKLQMIGEIFWVYLMVMYLLVATSRKSAGYVSFKDNPNRGYFSRFFIIIGIVCVVAIFTIFATNIYFDSTSSSISLSTCIRIIQKINIINIAIWLMAMIYYLILRMRFEKYGSNANKQSYIIRIVLSSLISLIIALVIVLLKLNVGDNFSMAAYGYPFIVKSIILFCAGISVNYQLLTQAESISPAKFIPVILFMPFYTLSSIIEFIEPNVIPNAVIFAIQSVYLYFTIENPDVKLIQELKASRASAESANSQKTRFLSVMSHEIRTPLNAIVGFGQTLKNANISAEAKEEVDDIIMSSNNLIDIVNGILDISKIETDELEIVEKEYDSGRMFREIIALAKARLASKPIDLRINIDSTIPPVLYGDYLRVKQVIINILTNSIKYTNQGSIDFRVNGLASGDKLVLDVSVKDTGIGIKKEDLNKLFTKFQRLDLEKNSSTEGTGLGLAITKRLVELMHGTITVDSIYGEGTTFTIRIEQGIVHKTTDDIEEENRKSNEIAKVDSNSRILVIDDNAINIKVFTRLLKDYNLNPDTATSGAECLDLIKSGHRYDLIFMDDMMPEMTGTETLAILREMPEFNTPVIAFTANAISGMREKYLASGFNEYLPKPVKKESLNELLDLFLNGRNAIDTNPANVHSIPNLSVAEHNEVSLKTPERNDLRVPAAKDAVNKDINMVEVNMHNKFRTKEYLMQNKVDVNHGLGILGDMDTYNMLIDEFDNGILERLEKIKKYKDESNWENYIIETHDLKKDAKYLGFTDLADLAYKHEMAGKEQNYDEINRTYDSLIREITRIMEVVKKYSKN